MNYIRNNWVTVVSKFLIYSKNRLADKCNDSVLILGKPFLNLFGVFYLFDGDFLSYSSGKNPPLRSFLRSLIFFFKKVFYLFNCFIYKSSSYYLSASVLILSDSSFECFVFNNVWIGDPRSLFETAGDILSSFFIF